MGIRKKNMITGCYHSWQGAAFVKGQSELRVSSLLRFSRCGSAGASQKYTPKPHWMYRPLLSPLTACPHLQLPALQ